MKTAKKWLASLMALALLACSLPAALAADWDNAKEVKNYDEFIAAVEDESVEEIKIVGEVTIPAAEEPLMVETPTLVAKGGKLTMAPDAVMFVHVAMGRFNFEDQENTWDHVAEMCEAFIIWHPEEDTYNRDIFGSMPDMNQQIKDANGEPINCLVFSGNDVNLTEDLSVEASFQIYDGNLTIGKDTKVEAGFLYVNGDLTLEEGASLTVTGEEGGTVTGKITAADDKQIPENVKTLEPPEEPETPAEPAAPKFTDVAATSPFAAAIDWAVEKEITLGKTETTFGPGDPCTVSHILTFLWRANGKPGAEEGVADRDSAAKWAVEKKMIAEDADLTATCTRSMAVTFMWQAAESPEVKTEKTFTDVAADAAYAGAVAWAVENEITAGTGDGTTFSPDNPCNRGQIVTFLYRSLAE